jgi:MFS family permease
LIVGRGITGFTAGNQPIAQTAMIDVSVDDTDRARNMGYIVTGISFGLVGGPIIGGFLCFHITNITFYIFLDNYLTSRFGYGALGGSMVMLTIGVSYPTFLGLYSASVGDEE